jgi:hypothetical protein
LPDTLLAVTEGSTIYLDVNAAGFGWFVDATPSDSREFHEANGTLAAFRGSEAFGRMDLLTVLTHELGHVLGMAHTDNGLMSATLGAGTRSKDLAADQQAITNLDFAGTADFSSPFDPDSGDVTTSNLLRKSLHGPTLRKRTPGTVDLMRHFQNVAAIPSLPGRSLLSDR